MLGEEAVVRVGHVDPTPEQPEDFVPLALVTPEGRHELATELRFPSRIEVLIVVGALLFGGILLGVLLSA